MYLLCKVSKRVDFHLSENLQFLSQVSSICGNNHLVSDIQAQSQKLWKNNGSQQPQNIYAQSHHGIKDKWLQQPWNFTWAQGQNLGRKNIWLQQPQNLTTNSFIPPRMHETAKVSPSVIFGTKPLRDASKYWFQIKAEDQYFQRQGQINLRPL